VILFRFVILPLGHFFLEFLILPISHYRRYNACDKDYEDETYLMYDHFYCRVVYVVIFIELVFLTLPLSSRADRQTCGHSANPTEFHDPVFLTVPRSRVPYGPTIFVGFVGLWDLSGLALTCC
jgi:hypothetical protein